MQWNWSEIALAVLSAITMGISGWWAFIGKRAQSAEQQQLLFYQQVIAECQSLRAGNNELQKQVMALQNEVHLLREKLEYYEDNPVVNQAREMLEAVMNGWDSPVWIHDISSNKCYLSDSYCETFHVQRPNFWTPVNILARYNADDAIQYVKNDMQVIESNASITFTERVRRQIMNPQCQDFFLGQFVKTPLRIRDRPYIFGKMICEVSE